EKKWQIHTSEAHLPRRPQDRRQDKRPEESAGHSGPENIQGEQRHRSAILKPPPRVARSRAMAASIRARCTSACGKLPRNSPLRGSTSSAYRPTSVARASNRSIKAVASVTRPTRASALTSQNEQFRKQ